MGLHQDCIVDVGCGSGRLTKQLSNQHRGEYIGTDVVQDSLDHAKLYCNSEDWKLLKVDELKIPIESGTANFVCFFQFSHICLRTILFILERSKKGPQGRWDYFIFFLEFAVPAHWSIFEGNLGVFENNYLNMFIDRDAIKAGQDILI